MVKVVLDTTKAYNHADGVFTVPLNGVYVFTWTTSVNNGRWQGTQLVVNGVPQANSMVDSAGNTDYNSGTQTVVLKVINQISPECIHVCF